MGAHRKMRDFREEYKAFLREYPYKTIEVDGVTVRYQRGEKKVRRLFCFSMDWKCRKCGCPMRCISVKNTDF